MIDKLSINILPVIVSVLLHGLLIWVVVRTWGDMAPPPEFKQPEFVKATLVELKTKAPERKVAPAPQQKVDLDADKKLQAAKELERKAQEAAKTAEAKQQADTAAKKAQELKAAKEKAALETSKEKTQKEAQEKLKQEKLMAERKAAEDARKRQQESKEKALREEEMMVAELASEQAVNSFTAIFKDRIAQKWSRPPSARRGMTCELVIQLVPTGRIVAVNIVKSSGNEAFDRSAEQAVRAVEQIPEMRDLDIAIFEKNFRTIHLLFNPEDLRL